MKYIIFLKNGKIDGYLEISEMAPDDLQKIIKANEMVGRKWEYSDREPRSTMMLHK